MHSLFSSLHLPMGLGIAVLAGLYAVKFALGYMLLARFRRWRMGRRRDE